jgi:RNA polymerase sigma factor (sigma-70 family)
MKMGDTDLELVMRYARQNAEDAFAELVRRHVNLVFSTALRLVRSRQVAEEVVQSVFTDLARQAQGLAADTILTAWLYRVTNRTAIDLIRREARRTLREHVAVQLNAMAATAADWTEIEPLLDEAMNGLSEEDRTAVLLRYFENKSLREVGETLRTSEEAARKRLGRAVERLREFFAARGITVGAAGLAVLISANAVEAAPIGLAATITAAVLAGTLLPASTTVAHTMLMTTLPKVVLGSTLVVAVGTGVFEAQQASGLRDKNQTLERRQAPLLAQIGQLYQELNDATNRLGGLITAVEQANRNDRELLALRGEVTRLRRESQALAQSKSKPEAGDLSDKAWLDRIGRLKQRLQQTPEAQIPELKLLNEEDWLYAASHKLETDEDYRAAFEDLRARGEGQFLRLAERALRKYLESQHDEFPTELSQLKPYFETAPEDEILGRYQIVPSSNIPITGNPAKAGDYLITLKQPDSNSLMTLGKQGVAGTSAADSAELGILAPAMKAMLEATPMINGKKSASIEDLAQYLTTSEERAAYDKLMRKRDAASK